MSASQSITMRRFNSRGFSKPSWGKIALVIGVTLALSAAWKWTPLADYLTPSRINDWAKAMRSNPWALVALTLAYTPAALVMFPRQIITLVAVIAFGPWLGFGTSFVGILLAAMAFYAAGRYVSYERIERICGKHLETVKDAAREHGIIAVFASNMAPLPPFSIQGIVAGAMKVKVWEYFAGTALSLIPGLIAISVFGRQISGMLQDPSDINLWLLGLTVIAFGAFMWWVKRWLEKRESRGSSQQPAH